MFKHYVQYNVLTFYFKHLKLKYKDICNMKIMIKLVKEMLKNVILKIQKKSIFHLNSLVHEVIQICVYY